MWVLKAMPRESLCRENGSALLCRLQSQLGWAGPPHLSPTLAGVQGLEGIHKDNFGIPPLGPKLSPGH